MAKIINLDFPLYEQLCEICELATRKEPRYLFPHMETPKTQQYISELVKLGLVAPKVLARKGVELTKAVPSELALKVYNERQLFPVFTEQGNWVFHIKKNAPHPMGKVSTFFVQINACCYLDALKTLNERALSESNDLPELWLKYQLVTVRASVVPCNVTDYLIYQ